MKLRVQIASVLDRDALVAEVWAEDEQIAELRHEAGTVRIEIPSRRNAKPWDLPLDELMAALAEAEDLLRVPERRA